MINRIVARQLRRLNLDSEQVPKELEQWQDFLKVIGETYHQNLEDRYLLERSLEISSREMSERLQKNKELSLQLMQASKLASIGTLASGIAHELNNPLQAIGGFLEIMARRELDRETTMKYFDRITRLTVRMAGTIKHLLKLSRGSQDQEKVRISIMDPIEEAHELLGKQLSYDQIEFEINNKSINPYVRGDLNQLFGVFQNLMANSRDAFCSQVNRKNSRIIIDIENSENSVVVHFQDNAGGIPDNVIGRIFDPFFTTKEVGSGTGLGLALARQAIEETNGTMTVQVKGIETTFIIKIPNAAGNSEEARSGSIDSVGEITHPGWKIKQFSILIVDDEEDICDQLESEFQQEFFVKKANSGDEAIKYLTTDKFDAVLTDLRMPGKSGLEVASFARKMNPDVKLVIMSGHIGSSFPPELEALQPFEYFEKPFKSLKIMTETVIDFVTKFSI